MIPVHFLICIPKLVGTLASYGGEGPFKNSLLFLYRLAYANKLQLPVLITVCFMALDIRLQLEINIFWADNHQNNRRREVAQQVNIIEVEEVEVAAENDDDDNDDASTLQGGETLDDEEEEPNFNPENDNKSEENGKKYDNDKDSDNNDNNGHSSNGSSRQSSNNSSNYDQHDHSDSSDENDDDQDGNSLLFHIEVTRNFTTNVHDDDNDKVEEKCISSSQYFHHNYNFNLLERTIRTRTTTKPSKLTLINDIKSGAFNLIAKSRQNRKYFFINSLNPHLIALL